MNKEELIGKLQMVYVGDKNALNELIGYYDGLKQGIDELQQENQKYKEVIDKAKEYMKDYIFEPLLTYEDRKLIMYNDNLRNFEKILKEVEKMDSLIKANGNNAI